MTENDEQAESRLETPNEDIPLISPAEDRIKPPAREASKEESRTRRFFMRLVRWSAGLLVVFGLGVIATIYFLYQPKVRELSEVNRQLTSANDEIISLQDQINGLEIRIEELSRLEDRNQALQDELLMADLRIHILSALSDVRAAQFALGTEDVALAKVQLVQTLLTLEELKQLVKPGLRQAVDNMVQRLDLVVGEMEEDPFAAQSDLEVLENNLVQLENTYFANP